MKRYDQNSISKSIFILCTIAVLLAMTVTPGVARNDQSISSGTTFVELSTDNVDTLDPALAYDPASIHVIYQAYEGLLFYNREKADEFIPMLATNWSLSLDGLTYSFNIRKGVKFHNGNSLTPSDVAYSLQRGILQGGSQSPQWLFTEPLLGVGIKDVTDLIDPSDALLDDRAGLQAEDPAGLLAACQQVKDAIEADDGAGTVTFTLSQAWDPFLGTLAGSWGTILDEQWAVANGGWDGDCDNWQDYYYVESSFDPISQIMNGTGPFTLEYWDSGVTGEVSLLRNDDYWRQKSEPLWFGAPGGPAYFSQVLIQIEDDETTRYNALISGNADTANSLISNYSALDSQVLFSYASMDALTPSLVDSDGILNRYLYNSPASFDGFFVYDIQSGGSRNYIGSGDFDGEGIRPDFFSDDNVRKAFSHAFNYDQFILDAYGGSAIRRRGPIPEGVTGYSATSTIYDYNPTLAAAEMAAAFEGQLDDIGFKMTLSYSNRIRQAFVERLAADIQALNPGKYVVEVADPLDWPTYNSDQDNMPIFAGGWMADIPHPHNWVSPYMTDYYALRQQMPESMRNPYEVLVNNCLAQHGAAAVTCYQGLQSTAIDDAIDLFLAQPSSRTYVSASIREYYVNYYVSGAYIYALTRGSLPDVQSYAPSSGRTINFNTAGDGIDTVYFPIGAIAENYDIAVTSDTRVTHFRGGSRPAGTGFDIQAFQSGTLADGLNLLSPAVVNLSYSNEQVLGLVEEQLTIYYWDGDSWEDASCGTITRNTDFNTLSVPICHLSNFALGSEVPMIFLPLIRK
jgi:peptide/nickel transport system substrate-binding protein